MKKKATKAKLGDTRGLGDSEFNESEMIEYDDELYDRQKSKERYTTSKSVRGGGQAHPNILFEIQESDEWNNEPN